MLDILPCYDKDDDGHLHIDEFNLLVQNPELRVALNRFGVDVDGLVLVVTVLLENLRVEFLIAYFLQDDIFASSL